MIDCKLEQSIVDTTTGKRPLEACRSYSLWVLSVLEKDLLRDYPKVLRAFGEGFRFLTFKGQRLNYEGTLIRPT